jgi:3-oxoacyl-[acyl-carrier-protein] synthase-3
MNGRQVFRFATSVVGEAILEVLGKAGLTLEDVDLIVPHQANSRIVEAIAKKLKVPDELFFMNLDRAGNTSAASIPVALCDAVQANRLKPDDVVVFVGFGGGLTWGASVIKWDVTAPTPALLDREWKRARYIVARTRSKLRRWWRRLVALFGGSPHPDARLRDAKKKR